MPRVSSPAHEMREPAGNDDDNAAEMTPQDSALLRLAGASNIFAVTSEKDLADVLTMVKDGDGILVVDYYAPWCRACRRLLRQIEQLARHEAYQGVTFATVDFEQARELCRAKKLKKLPTLEVYRGESLQQRWTGAKKQTLLNHLSEEMETVKTA